MHPDERAWAVDFCVAQSKAGVDHEADYRALTRDGRYVWIRDVVHVVRNEQGEVEALVGFMFDISERKKNEQKLLELQRELERLSFKDGLTGVGNRRHFENVLEREWQQARENRQPLSVVMIDIDFFKQYNDRYGHVAGDDCLRRVGRLLDTATGRPRDFLARFGGEEFVLVLPDTDADTALRIAERCRELIAAEAISHENSPASRMLTVSMGVGTRVPDDDAPPLSFIAEVDRSLYLAKQRGRDRIVAGSRVDRSHRARTHAEECPALPASGCRRQGSVPDIARLQGDLLARAQHLTPHFAKTQAGMEPGGRRVGRSNVEFAGEQRHPPRSRVPEGVAVEQLAHAPALRLGSDHDAIHIEETWIALGKPTVIGTVVVGTLAHGEQEGGDPPLLLRHAVQRGLSGQVREASRVQRAQHRDERLVEGKDGRRVVRHGIAKQHGIGRGKSGVAIVPRHGPHPASRSKACTMVIQAVVPANGTVSTCCASSTAPPIA